ncbi:MAG: thioredoxin fold domain-containing protein [Litorivicinaceae bacterium]
MRWLMIALLSWTVGAHADEAAIRAAILGINPQIEITSIQAVAETPLFEVTLSTGERLYTTASGSHFVAGDLYQVAPGGVMNLTDVGRRVDRMGLLQALADDELVIFKPQRETVQRLTVFTDIDCGFCRKLHEEIDDLLAAGIEVRYVAFPRSGPNTPSFEKYVSVVCGNDPQTLMTEAKAGKTPPKATCPNTVHEQFELGRQLGVTGTPTLIFPNGQMVPGYLPADELINRLNQSGS